MNERLNKKIEIAGLYIKLTKRYSDWKRATRVLAKAEKALDEAARMLPEGRGSQ